jgi:hypothetical protein
MALYRAKGKGRCKMIALVGMIACGAGLAGFAGAYFWPVPGASTPINLATETTPDITVHNLFLDDFQTGSYKMILSRSTPLYKEGRNIGEFPFEMGFYGDFQAKSLFMSFYAPGSARAFELISWFSNAYKDYLYDATKNIHIWSASPGTQNPLLSGDLLFTKKIYVYYENIMTSEQLRVLTDLFAKEGAEVEFRGFNYMEYRKKAGPALSASLGKMTETPSTANPTPWHVFAPDPANQKQPTLLTLFLTELRAEHGSLILGKKHLSMQFAPNNVTQTVDILCAIFYDRPKHIISVAIYTPKYDYTPSVIIFAISNITGWIDEANHIIGKKEDLGKFQFSRDVYLYNEEPITNDAAKSEIAKAMSAAGFTYEYRSQDYLAMFRYQVETHARPMPPMYEWSGDMPNLAPGQKDAHQPDWSISLPAASPPFPVPPASPAKK